MTAAVTPNGQDLRQAAEVPEEAAELGTTVEEGENVYWDRRNRTLGSLVRYTLFQMRQTTSGYMREYLLALLWVYFRL